MEFLGIEWNGFNIFLVLVILLMWLRFAPAYIALNFPSLRDKLPRWALGLSNLVLPYLEPFLEQVWELAETRMEELAASTPSTADDELVEAIKKIVRDELGYNDADEEVQLKL